MKEIGIEEVHDILYDIMVDVDEFCRREGIRYSLGYGTLLGAVRSGDFIPWDDDADIIMPRADFDRFTATYKGKYSCIMDVRTPDVFYVSGHAKVHDPSTNKYIGSKKFRLSYGVSLDIFPLDPVPDDGEECRALMKKAIHTHRRLLYRSRLFPHGSLLMLMEAYMHSYDWWLRRCNAIARSCDGKDCSRIGVLMGARSMKNIHPKNFFEHLGEIRLREHSFPCPEDPAAYLSQIYGPDYMTPPPESERTGHGGSVWKL